MSVKLSTPRRVNCPYASLLSWRDIITSHPPRTSNSSAHLNLCWTRREGKESTLFFNNNVWILFKSIIFSSERLCFSPAYCPGACPIYFYAPGWNDRGHIVFVLSVCLFVCLFVCLLSTLTFAITFEPLEVETSYLVCILHYWCPFKWHQGQWPFDLDFDLCSKNSFFGLCCRRGHSQCFTNTPWFFSTQIKMWYVNIVI